MDKESDIEFLTKRLVSQESISNPEDDIAKKKEAVMADVIFSWFQENNIFSMLQHLPDGRKNVFALAPGKSPKTIILLGHLDTVGVNEYYDDPNIQAGDPFQPDVIAKKLGVNEDQYIAGRGAFDMKAGLAVGMTLMHEWVSSNDMPDGNILFIATCDEENDSYGILHTLEILTELKSENKAESDISENIKSAAGEEALDLLGVINLDYTTERFPGDPEYHVWNGTIGKTLPSILVSGQETHVGEHFSGFHASSLMSRIVSQIEGNMELADGNVPPTTLKLSDGKDFYNVMTAKNLQAYFNVFSVGKAPADILDAINEIVVQTVNEYITSIEKNYGIYKDRMFTPTEQTQIKLQDWRNTRVLTYSQLLKEVHAWIGEAETQKIIQSVTKNASGDGRVKSFAIVEKLLNVSGISGPVVVIFFSPPFYPFINPDNGMLYESTMAAIQEINKIFNITITMQDYYPYISDMSFLKLEPEIQKKLSGLTSEMPIWNLDETQETGKKIYNLDQDKILKIAKLDLPVVNVGPYGFGAHKTNEMVEKKYSFTILPELIRRIVGSLFNQQTS